MYIPRTCTLNVESRPDTAGVWLCLDNGNESVPLAQFVSKDAAEQFKHALNIACMKSHAVGASGI